MPAFNYQEVIFIIYESVAIMLFGSIGNILTIIILIKSKKVYETNHMFIFNLAISDFFTCLFPIHTWALMIYNEQEKLTHIICNVMAPFHNAVIYHSQLELIIIAINRLVFILKSKEVYYRWFSLKLSVVWCILGWIISFVLFFSPLPSGTYKYSGLGLSCGLYNAQYVNNLGRIYTIILLIITLPLIAILYLKIFLAIRASKKRVMCSTISSTTSDGSSKKHLLFQNTPFLLSIFYSER